MDIKKHLNSTKIYQEFDDENQKYWFDFKQKKFLHNIDTFYYSVKLVEDLQMTHLMIPFSGFVNSLSRRNQSLTPGMDNLYRSSFLGLTAALICALALTLVFSVFVWNARNGLIFSLLLLSLMVLMVVSPLRLRSLYNSDLICCGCMEFMKPLNALMNM